MDGGGIMDRQYFELWNGEAATNVRIKVWMVIGRVVKVGLSCDVASWVSMVSRLYARL